MSYVNGVLTVPSFNPTGNPGEYTITGATYNNQGDNVGAGTSAIVIGFVLYVQASDPNTFFQIPGQVHRYEITALTIVDSATINATVLWNEPGLEQNVPTNGIDCIISSVSVSKGYGYGVEESLYPTLTAGMFSGMLNVDVANISDDPLVDGGSFGT